MRLEVAELGLPALDAAAADGLGLFVGPERPLQGLAGLADWRLAGALTRALQAGHYRGAAGEQLLLPAGGRLGVARILCFGLAEAAADEAAFAAAAGHALEALRRAGCLAQVVALPPVRPGALAPARQARLWLEACLRSPPARQLLLGDAAALRGGLAEARDALRAPVELAEAVPAGAPSLPHPRGVLR